MKIQCDVCEKAAATLICVADEAALCSKCDIEIHAANRLASKHQRLLLLQSSPLSTKFPLCDICREKTAFIFCVEDRALFCHDCDEPIHSANKRAANHQRFLATGIQVALTSSSSSSCPNKKDDVAAEQAEPPPPPPPIHNNNSNNTSQYHHLSKSSLHHHVSNITSPSSWSVDELLHLSEYDTSSSSDPKKQQLEFGGLEWLTDMSLFGEQIAHEEEALAAAEVPQLPVVPQFSHGTTGRTPKYSMPFYKKPRIELPSNEDDDDDDEYFLVPDLG